MNPCSAYRNRFRKTLLPAAFAALLLTPAGAMAAPMYTITDLGGLPVYSGGPLFPVTPVAINDLGQVVGGSVAGSFLWQNGVITNLGDLPGLPDGIPGHPGAVTARDINNSGQVVGKYSNSVGTLQGFTWQNGILTDLGDPGGHSDIGAYSVNDRGQVAGRIYAGISPRAFLWDSVNGITNLGLPPGGFTGSFAHDINDNGQVVGMGTGPLPYNRAFLWEDGVATNLGALSGEFYIQSSAAATNNNGQVVGWSGVTNARHAFLQQNTTMTDLGYLPGWGDDSEAFDINDSGQVVGRSGTNQTGHQAFFWNSTDGLQNLNDLLVDPAGWNLTKATAINKSGQVVGNGVHGGGVRGFILNPVAGTMANNPLLPDTGSPDGSFDFTFESDLAGGEDEMIFIDPIIAIGYDYIVASGPNIATILLPTILSDDGLFDIYLWDGDGFDIFAGIAEDGVAFDFTALAGFSGGVDRFRVLGIDQAALLDPANPAAFVTGLTFVSSGTVNMSMVAVTFDTEGGNGGGNPTGVPEPMAATLLGAGLASMVWTRRRRA